MSVKQISGLPDDDAVRDQLQKIQEDLGPDARNVLKIAQARNRQFLDLAMMLLALRGYPKSAQYMKDVLGKAMGL